MSDRCSTCPGKHKCIPFVGPAHAQLKFIGEAPGRDEDKKGEVFIGKTGREVNEGYFPLAGIRRSDVRIGNAISCLPDTPQNKLNLSKDQHKQLLTTCASHGLYNELQQYPASLIIPMGAFACYAIDPDIDLELQHGIPIQTKWGMCFPMYHPAGGIHEPKKMLQIRTDWYRLRQYLKGTLEVAYDSYSGTEDYGVCTTKDSVFELLSPDPSLPLACDTETTKKKTPFCLSFTTRAGQGRVIKADNLDALEEFQYCLDNWEGPILWHNWLFDHTVTRKMGLKFPRRLIVDTMVRAFNLGNIPQGLKALSYRELGMKMMDFNDMVKPHSTERVLKYLGDCARMDWPKPDKISVRQDDGTFKDKQPHSMKTKFKTFWTGMKKNPDKDPFEAWDNWEDSHELIQAQMGEWPGKCITHAAEDDWEKVLFYSCRDADALRRLWDVILHMESRIRKAPQEQWRDTV